MNIQFISLIITAYLLGSVPSAFVAARLSRGIDIREYGSGNVGGSNLFKLVPLWVALPSFAYDIAKGTMPVFIAGRLGMSFTEQVIVGVAAIAGHNWPVFLGFNGGRGITTTLGTVLLLMPKLTLILLSIVLISIIFHQMALFTIIVIALFPVFSYLSGIPAAGYLMGRTLPDEERIPATLALLAILLIVVIRRLTAPKSELAAGLNPGELYVNRLLWDRDIRDRKAWINRNLENEATGDNKKG